ncbi:MAG: hypothetical protein ACKVQK_19505 [Burkholderiales bacterium]
MSLEHDGLAQSVQARLAWHAKAIGVDLNRVVMPYGIERIRPR